MRKITEEGLTAEVLDRLGRCDDPRLREVLISMVHHLHSFVRQVRPSEAEWFKVIEFLTATGQKCDTERQEFILLSDTLGVSMLVDAINHPAGGSATETTVLGPFFVAEAKEMPLGADIAGGQPGTPLWCEGTVAGAAGEPLADCTVDVWQSDSAGSYDVQKPDRDDYHLRGRFRTDAEGRFGFWTIVPSSYPIPTDGPVGKLLASVGRHPYRPAHVHFMLQAKGHQRLITQLYIGGDTYIDSDVVFGVKDSLVKALERRPAASAPGGRKLAGEYAVMRESFKLAPAA